MTNTDINDRLLEIVNKFTTEVAELLNNQNYSNDPQLLINHGIASVVMPTSRMIDSLANSFCEGKTEEMEDIFAKTLKLALDARKDELKKEQTKPC